MRSADRIELRLSLEAKRKTSACDEYFAVWLISEVGVHRGSRDNVDFCSEGKSNPRSGSRQWQVSLPVYSSGLLRCEFVE
jgi:hypothetical protein